MKTVFKLTNQGEGEINDHVYPKVFNLDNGAYTFTLIPQINTTIWRFGIRFSKTETIEFATAGDRHRNARLKDITIAVGKRTVEKKWGNPEFIEFGSYHTSEKFKVFNESY